MGKCNQIVVRVAAKHSAADMKRTLLKTTFHRFDHNSNRSVAVDKTVTIDDEGKVLATVMGITDAEATTVLGVIKDFLMKKYGYFNDQFAMRPCPDQMTIKKAA